MDCEVCGSLIFGNGYHITIDGAELVVCRECSTLKTSPSRPRPDALRSARSPTGASQKKTLPLPPRRRPTEPTMPEGRELVQDYGQVIRRAREALQLSQEDLGRKIAEKNSVLQKIEGGRFVPPEALVQKLERALKIRLVQEASEVPTDGKAAQPEELTLGDVAVMRKKRGEAEVSEGRRH